MNHSSENRTPLVSVLIINWNRCEDLREAILSAKEQTYPHIQLVVVDNGSVDGSVEMLTESFPEVKLIRLHRNVGCPEGRNIGMINCDGEIIFSLDDDGTIEKDVIEKVVDAFDKNNRIGVVSIKLIDCYSDEAHPVGQVSDLEQNSYVASFSGGASAIRKSILNATGYYPHSFIYGGEENYLAYSIFNAGYLIYYLNDAKMFHKVSSKQRSAINNFKRRFNNDLVTTWRYFPLHLAFVATLRKYYLHLKTAVRQKRCLSFLGILAVSPLLITKTRLTERVKLDDATIIMMMRVKDRSFVDLESLDREFQAIRKNPSYTRWLLRKA
jgi:GT2 family glycosyltransferase